MGTNEVDFLNKQIESYISRALQGGVCLTLFLDEEKQHLFKNNSDVDILFDGGFDGAEYKRVLIKSKDVSKVDFKICIFEIKYNKRYLELNHRKVLGSLMNLGIKRQSIGDIVFVNDKCYFACSNEISLYIENEFKTISGISIELEKIDDRITVKRQIREEKHNVSSLRLDVIIASAYKLSRNETLNMIESGLVKINHEVCLSSSKILKENDLISVRHKGRIYIGEVGGKTKSNRMVLQLKFLV